MTKARTKLEGDVVFGYGESVIGGLNRFPHIFTKQGFLQ